MTTDMSEYDFLIPLLPRNNRPAAKTKKSATKAFILVDATPAGNMLSNRAW